MSFVLACPLQTLGFHDCAIDDEKIEAIMRALAEASNRRNNGLKEMWFSSNYITHRGLQSLCETPTLSAFPHLQKLMLFAIDLLDDQEITQRFVQEILISPDTTVKELDISWCSEHAARYTIFIKILETNGTLLRLNVSLTL
jgi:hypothetical protein